MSKQDVLESRLRHQEDMISSYQAQLDRSKTELDIARREAASLRTQLASASKGLAPSEAIDVSFRASLIEFSTLMTGGADLDGQPGDDGLSVVLVPQSPDGEIVKVPGTVEIEAFDLSSPGGARRIGHWVFDSSESHRYWHKGVIQSGYQFEIPWQDLPRSESLLLHGRLVAADGRQFDTTHTIRIEPPDSALADQGTPSRRDTDIQQAAAASESDAIRADSTNNGGPTPSWSDLTEVSTGAVSERHTPPRSEAQSYTGGEFSDRLKQSGSLHGSRPSLSGRGDSNAIPARPHSAEASSGTDVPWGNSLEAEIPPQIQMGPPDRDGAEGNEWYQKTDRPPVRTSDSWNDATIPYIR